MSLEQYSGGPNPFFIANKMISDRYNTELRKQHRIAQAKLLRDTLSMHKAHNDAVTEHLSNATTQEEPQTTTTPIQEEESPTMTTATTEKITPTSTHPITGESVPTVPVKRSKYKKTAPGTKPKIK